MVNENADTLSAAAFYEMRQRWLDLLCEHREISRAAFRVGYFLARRMNGKTQNCWFSVQQIARRLGSGVVRDTGGTAIKQKMVSTHTVSAAIAELERAGMLVVVRHQGKGNVYSIREPLMEPTQKMRG